MAIENKVTTKIAPIKPSQVLPGLIERHNVDIIYSCGPMAMLAAIQDIATQTGIMHQCAVEESMACGIGVCMTCVVPIKHEDSIKMVRTCIDGPVMDGSEIIWDRKSAMDML